MKQVAKSLSTIEIAKDLGIGRATAFRWCESGKLPAIRIGNVWRVPLEPYLRWKGEHVHTVDGSDHALLPLIDQWLNFLTNGPNPLARRTVECYRYYFQMHMRLAGGAISPAEIASREAVTRSLEKLPVASYSNRYNLYYAVVSFTKFLVGRNILQAGTILNLTPLRPKRVHPPRRTVMDSEQANRLLSAIWVTNGNSEYERRLNFALIKTLLLTGLRCKELCDLSLSDVDLGAGTLIVQKGKGGKSRPLGVTRELAMVLNEYLSIRPCSSSRAFFLAEKGVPLTPRTLSRRIQRLSNATGISITAHGMRRTFTTQALLQGKPLAVVSKALGHSQVSTTQQYLLLSERQVIEEMKGW